MNLEEAIDPKPVESFLRRKADLQEDIEHLQKENQALKQARKETARHIRVGELPEEDRFEQLSTRKLGQFIWAIYKNDRSLWLNKLWEAASLQGVDGTGRAVPGGQQLSNKLDEKLENRPENRPSRTF